MKEWIIGVSWQMCGEIKVEAETLEEALKIAQEDDGIPLPAERHYIDASWEVDEETSRYLNEEDE